MADLENQFPSWGETGSYPSAGFFYEGGDQVNEKHMDALWNGIKSHLDEFITGVEDRVVEGPYGDYVGDSGLVASTGSGTREVDVTATNFAYVGGQRVANVSAQTTTHTANGTASTRTDVVYLDQDGTVARDENATSPPSDTLKIAEVDVDTNDTITEIRNYVNDRVPLFSSEQEPAAPDTDTGVWHDIDQDIVRGYVNGAWRGIAVDGETPAPFEFSGDVQLTNGSSVIFPEDAGAESLADMSVSGTPAQGVEQSLTLAVDGTGLLKAYAEADGAGGIQNQRTEVLSGNLRVPTGNALEDGGGTSRVKIGQFNTVLTDQAGQNSFLAQDGQYNRIYSRSSIPAQIYDTEQTAVGVQYDTDATAGVLRTPNAGTRIESRGEATTGAGLELVYDTAPATDIAYIRSYDRDASTHRNIELQGNTFNIRADGGLIDASVASADLRLAFGQEIEDESGTGRVRIHSNSRTIFNNGDGQAAFDANSSLTHRINAYSGIPIEFFDNEGSFSAAQYTTSASAPGVLELTNAHLKFGGNRGIAFDDVAANAGSSVSDPRDALMWPDQGGGSSFGIWGDVDGEMRAGDDDGNVTILT